MNHTRVNLNADLGESFGAWKMGDDAALLQVCLLYTSDAADD